MSKLDTMSAVKNAIPDREFTVNCINELTPFGVKDRMIHYRLSQLLEAGEVKRVGGCKSHGYLYARSHGC